jgi:hypothetical protein
MLKGFSLGGYSNSHRFQLDEKGKKSRRKKGKKEGKDA